MPIKSKISSKLDKEIINKPLITPITTETLYVCISFIVNTVVNKIVIPDTSINIHWKTDGTIICDVGNNIGRITDVSRRN